MGKLGSFGHTDFAGHQQIQLLESFLISTGIGIRA